MRAILFTISLMALSLISNGQEADSTERIIFLVVENPPEYIGGMGASHELITKNLKYPADAKRMQIEGSVFVQFIVEPDGSLTEAQVIKGISKDCNDEALRLIKLMPKWKPGTQSGKPVRVRFVYPIRFRLD